MALGRNLYISGNGGGQGRRMGPGNGLLFVHKTQRKGFKKVVSHWSH